VLLVRIWRRCASVLQRSLRKRLRLLHRVCVRLRVHRVSRGRRSIILLVGSCPKLLLRPRRLGLLLRRARIHRRRTRGMQAALRSAVCQRSMVLPTARLVPQTGSCQPSTPSGTCAGVKAAANTADDS
jgi:hypothetical protein